MHSSLEEDVFIQGHDSGYSKHMGEIDAKPEKFWGHLSACSMESISPQYRFRLSPYSNLQNGAAVNYGILPGQFSHGQLKLL